MKMVKCQGKGRKKETTCSAAGDKDYDTSAFGFNRSIVHFTSAISRREYGYHKDVIWHIAKTTTESFPL
jgi:hypothetical protein